MKKIVILSGGTGKEREIAIKTSNFFKKYINQDYDYYELPEDLDKFLENKDKYDLAIPAFHGEYGEDGKIFAFLDVLGIKHTFSDYRTHSLCLDKYKNNELVKTLGVNIPKEFIYKGYLEIKTFPLIVKPNNGGSSFFTYKVSDEKEFYNAIKDIQDNVVDDILVQDFILGEEYSVGIVDGIILPIMKLDKNEDELFDYSSKYISQDKIKETWPEININLKNKLISDSKKIYNFLNIRGVCRIDYLVRNDNIFFLEVNTIPGMTDESIIPQSWNLTGRTYEELVKVLLSC